MTQAFNLSQFANFVNTSGKASLTTAVTGTLPIANGGTGSASTAYCSLTSNVTGTLPIANGGTGATTAAGALANLGALQGSSPQLVKAWVTFGSTGSINTSYNVSSVTHNGTGDWTINYTTGLANSYGCVSLDVWDTVGNTTNASIIYAVSSSYCRVLTKGAGGGYYDFDGTMVSVMNQ